MISLPDERPRDPVVRLMSEGRYTLTVQNADLAGILLGLAHDLPINVVVEPGVTGTVDADLKNVSLLDLLQQLVIARGYQYQIEGRTVRIFRTDRETRTWQIDYPSTRQNGESQFSVSGAVAQSVSSSSSSSSGSSIGGSQSQDTSTSGISTELSLDFWTEIERGVRLLVEGSEGAVDAPATDGEAATVVPIGAAGSGGRRVLVSRQAGLLLVTAPGAALDEVDRYLELAARSLGRQVLIDTRIIEVTLGDELDLGLDIEFSPSLDSTGGQSPAGTIVRAITGGIARDNAISSSDLAPVLTTGGFTFGIATDTIGVMLTALARQSDVRVVSTPKIATLNNHKAIVKVVRNEVFFVAETEVSVIANVGQSAVTTFTPTITPVGVTLDVTPQISEDNDVTLHVHPSVSEIVEVREQPLVAGQTASGSLPVVNLRETDCVVRVRDGETLVIGGLIQTRDLDIEKKLPLLGDIPWLGQLFRQSDVVEVRSELVIFLSPTVLDAPTIRRVDQESQMRLGALDDTRVDRRVIEPRWWRK
jgi:MSHA biogenesis protein MshL